MSEEVTLPMGFWVDDRWYRKAHLNPLSGADEVFLCEEARFLSAAHRTTAILARSLDRLGPMTPVTPSAVRALSVGDREALLLHVRRMTLGDRISCVLSCQNASCGAKMDLEFNTTDLLVSPYKFEKYIHETIVQARQETYAVRFRLPNGIDQEAVAELAVYDDLAAANLILQRCVEEITLE